MKNISRYLIWILVIVSVLLVAGIANISQPGRRTFGCLDGCAATGLKQFGPLRVMSLNLLHGFPEFNYLPERIQIIADEIKRREVDVALLQEVPWTVKNGNAAELIAHKTGMNFIYLRANGNRKLISFEEGEAILSRYPLKSAHFVELQPRISIFEHRVALSAIVITPWGDVPVVVTHLTHHDEQSNYLQCQSLQAFVESIINKPAIIAGDFNAEEDTPQIQALSQQWIDSYRSIKPYIPGMTCCIEDLTSGPEEVIEKRIDYLFLVPSVENHLQIQNIERVFERPSGNQGGWLWASDHIGLLAEITVSR